MSIETIVTLSTLITALFAIWKGSQEVGIKRQSFPHDQFRVTKEFIEEIRRDDPHPFVIEQGFQAILGKPLRADEIKYLLDFSNPSKILEDYVEGKHYLEYDNNYKKIDFKLKYRGKKLRNRLKRNSFIWYMTCLGLVIIPFSFFEKIFGNFDLSDVFNLVLYVISLLFVAFLSLIKIRQIKAAERVIKAEGQRKEKNQALEMKRLNKRNGTPVINNSFKNSLKLPFRRHRN